MKRLTIITLGIMFCLVLVTAGVLPSLIDNKEKEPVDFTTSQWDYSGAYTIKVTGDERNWVESVGITEGKITITSKSEVDRTYQKCIEFNTKEKVTEKNDPECIKWEEAIYEVPSLLPVASGEETDKLYYQEALTSKEVLGKNEFEYQMTELKVHKLGEHSIIVIPDIITNADLVNITVEDDYTHLNLTDDILLYMPFDVDSGTTYYDYSKFNNDGTGLVESSGSVANAGFGEYGNSTLFTSSSGDTYGGCIFIPNSAELKATIKNFTISFWVYRNDISDDPWLVDKWYDGSNRQWVVYIAATNRFKFALSDATGGSDLNPLFGPASLSIYTWYHVVLSVPDAGGNVYAYVNNVQYGPWTKTGTCYPNNNNVAIGCFDHGSIGPYHYMNGYIDDVMIINKTLSSTEVGEIYDSQYDRVVNGGTHNINQNISTGWSTVDITGDYLALNGSSVDLELLYYNATGWFSSGSQTYDGDNTYSISTTATNLSLNFTYDAGTYNFYSPILLGENGLTLDIQMLYDCAYVADSGDYKCNQECTITDETYNVSNASGYQAVRMYDGCTLNLVNSTIISNKRSLESSGDSNAKFNITGNSTWRFAG